MGGPRETPASRDLQAPSRTGVRLLHCFSWGGHRKRPGKGASSPPASPDRSPAGALPALPRACSTSSETEAQLGQAFVSEKARVSFRHRLDSATAAIDSTG